MTTHAAYYHVGEHLLDGEIPDLDASGTEVRCALLSEAHEPDLEGDTWWDDVSDDEVDAGGNYDAGGQALDGRTIDRDGDRAYWTANDVVWESSSIEAAYAVTYETDSEALLTLVDFEDTRTSFSGEFRVSWDDGVVLYLSEVA